MAANSLPREFNKPQFTVRSIEEEAIIVVLRKHSRLAVPIPGSWSTL